MAQEMLQVQEIHPVTCVHVDMLTYINKFEHVCTEIHLNVKNFIV